MEFKELKTAISYLDDEAVQELAVFFYSRIHTSHSPVRDAGRRTRSNS